MMLLEQYFFNGQVHECYQLALAEANLPNAQQFIALFERFDYQNIPQLTKMNEKQSVETRDEMYEEQQEVERIRAISDEAQFQQEIAKLEQRARTGSSNEKAQSFFTQGQLFLYAHHYDESVHCFKQSIIHSPNKALFYGYTGQTMQRLNYAPFEVLAYIDRALQLDQQNARWYWNKGLALMQLYKDLQNDAFLENAIVALEAAQQHCRADQVSLKTAIDNTFEIVRELIMQ